MKSSYKKLWKLLIDKGMNKTDLRKATGLCSSTIARMVKGEDVTVSTLSRICAVLECNIGDIVDLDTEPISARSKRKSVKRSRFKSCSP